jgi:pSer/pThr/pTyr-binding forkhead associated (FHA) protein
VLSPKREVSATHLEISEVDGALTARDLGSTNGTVVVTPSRAPRLLDGRRTTDLVEGDVLDIGEGFHIVIVNRSTL